MPSSFMKSIYSGYTAKEKGNQKEAFEHFQQALDQEKDSPIAAYELALYYEEGAVVQQDLEKAFYLYSQAANGCVENAQRKLADWYGEGIYVERNGAKAKVWREKAAAQKKLDDEPPLTLAESIRQKIAEIQVE